MSIGEGMDSWQSFPQCWQKRICFNTSLWACIKLNFVNPNIVKNAMILDPWNRPNFEMVCCVLHWTWEADKWTNWKICFISSTKTFTSQHPIKNMLRRSVWVWSSEQCVILHRKIAVSFIELSLSYIYKLVIVSLDVVNGTCELLMGFWKLISLVIAHHRGSQ